MPIPSKFPGWDLVLDHEPFQETDLYNGERYEEIPAHGGPGCGWWSRLSEGQGPKFPGQTFSERHGVKGYTVIRKSSNWKPLPRRLVLSKVGCIPLPLP